MSQTYQSEVQKAQEEIKQAGTSWHAIGAEAVARMRMMNRFQNGLEIAQYTADIMRKDMEEYDADPS
ncbi:MAG: isocitrate lyase, partial [Alcaligenaceae bacterium]|nr:isocitrate lyase [Alcaligenaceae bacterium]